MSGAMSKKTHTSTTPTAGKGKQTANQTWTVQGSSVLPPDVNSHVKSIYTKIQQIRGLEPDKSPPKTINWTDIDDELAHIGKDHDQYKIAFESIKQAFDKTEPNKADNGAQAKPKTSGSGAKQTSKPKASTPNSGGKKAATPKSDIGEDLKEIKDNIQNLKRQITSMETERSGQQTLLKEIKESIICQNNTAVLNKKVKPREKDHKTNRDTGTGRQTRSNQTQQTKDKVSASSEDNCHDLISFISMETKQMSVEITELRSVLEKVHETIDDTKTGPAKVENRKDAPPLQPQMVLQELKEYIELKTVRDRDEDEQKKKEALLAKTNKKNILERYSNQEKDLIKRIKENLHELYKSVKGQTKDKDDLFANLCSEVIKHASQKEETLKELTSCQNKISGQLNLLKELKESLNISYNQEETNPKATPNKKDLKRNKDKDKSAKTKESQENISVSTEEIYEDLISLIGQETKRMTLEIIELRSVINGQINSLKEIKESMVTSTNEGETSPRVTRKEKDNKHNKDKAKSNKTKETQENVSMPAEENYDDLITFIEQETKRMTSEIKRLKGVMEEHKTAFVVIKDMLKTDKNSKENQQRNDGKAIKSPKGDTTKPDHVNSNDQEIKDIQNRMHELIQEYQEQVREFASFKQNVFKRISDSTVNPNSKKPEQKRKNQPNSTGSIEEFENLLQQADSAKQEKMQQEIDKLKTENDSLQTRLSKVAGTKLAEGNPSITNLSDPNRPMKLAEMYTELYDNEWTDVMDKAQDRIPEDKILQSLCETVLGCYNFCMAKNSEIDKKLSEHVRLITKTLEIDVDNSKEILSEVKTYGKLSTDAACQKYLQEMRKIPKQTLKDIPKEAMTVILSSPFFDKCFNLCWKMVLQFPPMVLEVGPESGNTFDKTKFREYTRSGTKVVLTVWPALLLDKGGPLLVKGVLKVK